MSAALKAKARATYADLEAVPRGKVAELIGGQLYVFPRPAPRHATAASRLVSELSNPFDLGDGSPGSLISSRSMATKRMATKGIAAKGTAAKRMEDYRYRLIVTFDVPGAKRGDRRYDEVDDLLREHGDLTKIFKQVRLLSTETLPSRLAPLISKIVGPQGAVLIVHAAKPYRFVLGNQNVKALTRPWVRLWMDGAK